MRFRSLAATLDFRSLDRSYVQYAAIEMCTKVAKNPTRGSWIRLKKACSCSSGVKRLTWVIGAWKHDSMTVNVHVDSDWAQGTERKSTSGGMVMVNGTVVKHGSRTQA